jgi:hypothetical protein
MLKDNSFVPVVRRFFFLLCFEVNGMIVHMTGPLFIDFGVCPFLNNVWNRMVEDCRLSLNKCNLSENTSVGYLVYVGVKDRSWGFFLLDFL